MVSSVGASGRTPTKYGELAEDVEFAAIQIRTMAEDVADFILLQKKDVFKRFRF